MWLLIVERAVSRAGITRTAAYEVSPLIATGAAEDEHEVSTHTGKGLKCKAESRSASACSSTAESRRSSPLPAPTSRQYTFP